MLEIGSGTGQHAVFFAEQLPELTWLCSDLAENHPGIRDWIADYHGDNITGPYALDVCQNIWPVTSIDGIFSANTTHIMSWQSVGCLFEHIGSILNPGGYFCLYGPFNYNGKYTSASNERFDQYLRQRDPLSGLRDFNDLEKLAKTTGLQFVFDHEMPVNNRTLVWTKL